MTPVTSLSSKLRQRNDTLAFAPDAVRLELAAPSPLPRVVLYLLLLLMGVMLLWMHFGQLDVVAVAQGKLVPNSFLKIVQPAEAGIVREILVKEGEAVAEGQVLARMKSAIASSRS